MLRLPKGFQSFSDFDWITINLQALFWIEARRARLFRKIGQMTKDTLTGSR